MWLSAFRQPPKWLVLISRGRVFQRVGSVLTNLSQAYAYAILVP